MSSLHPRASGIQVRAAGREARWLGKAARHPCSQPGWPWVIPNFPNEDLEMTLFFPPKTIQGSSSVSAREKACLAGGRRACCVLAGWEPT